jgi:hypothetical protein
VIIVFLMEKKKLQVGLFIQMDPIILVNLII